MTNYLDHLIGKIEDPHLRSELSGQVALLRENKRFGLVFERHLPETVRLTTHPVRRGVRVQDRTVVDSTEWLVTAVTNGTASLLADDGEEVTRPVGSLVVVREFGQAVYPGLRHLGSVTHGGDKPAHLVFNAENYHALEMLTYAFAGQVDVMYLDPPYNSGAKDWTYNNHYVEASDQYRHSKWLSYMEKRLVKARGLLKDDSVMVVTIDEHEVTRLGVLLSQVFPAADITLVSIVTNPKGVTRPGVRRFSRVEEYAYFCFFGTAGISSWGDDLLTIGADDLERAAGDGVAKRPRWKGLLRSGTNARRQDRQGLFFPVLVDVERKAVLGAGEPLPLGTQPDFETKVDGLTPVWPVRSDGTLGNWGVGPATLRDMIARGYVALGGYDAKRGTWALSYLSKEPQEQIAAGVLEIAGYDEGRNVVDVVYADPDSAARRIKTVWHRTPHDAGAGGTDVLKGLLGGRLFTFPKSVYAVRDTLAMLTLGRPDALVVDFFAGSGTTLHAAAMLNAEDGGRRRVVLVTNNEVDVETQERLRKAGIHPGDAEWESEGIFQRATRPRVEAAITGRLADGSPVAAKLRNADGSAMAGGLHENADFFELVYLDRDLVERGRTFEQVARLLWLKAGGVGSCIDIPEPAYALPDDARYGVLFDVAAWRHFADEVAKRRDVTQLFVQTDSVAQCRQIALELPQGVPVTMLFDDYVRFFEGIEGGAA